MKHPRNCQLAVAVDDTDELVEETVDEDVVETMFTERLDEDDTLVEVEELELEELDELVDVGSEDVDDDELLDEVKVGVVLVDEDKVELLDDEVVEVEL